MGARNWYDDDLMQRAAKGPITAEETGKIMHCYGPDAITRLRGRRDLVVEIVGEIPVPKGPAKKLYQITEVDTRWSARREGLVEMK